MSLRHQDFKESFGSLTENARFLLQTGFHSIIHCYWMASDFQGPPLLSGSRGVPALEQRNVLRKITPWKEPVPGAGLHIPMTVDCPTTVGRVWPTADPDLWGRRRDAWELKLIPISVNESESLGK